MRAKRAKRAKKKPTTKVAARGPGANKGPTAKANKAEYVRTLPKSMPAKEAVAVAAKDGVKLTESYVYNVRGAAKAALKKKLHRGATYGLSKDGFAFGPGAAAPPAPAPITPEELLMAVASEVGLSRAILILSSARFVVANALVGHTGVGS